MNGAVAHGVIEYDDQDEWLTETDADGAAEIVARDVPRWFGHFVIRAGVIEAAARRVVAAADARHPDGLSSAWQSEEQEAETAAAWAVLREEVSPLGHGTPVPEEATLPSGDARVAAL